MRRWSPLRTGTLVTGLDSQALGLVEVDDRADLEAVRPQAAPCRTRIADGTVISELHRRHRAIEFKKFLTRIDKTVPAGLDVHLVCDNYATHNTPEIKTWLGRHPRFHVHFTPTGSSWMNQVERWFGLLTDKLIRRGVHTSVKALEGDIRAWIDTQNPRPFTWTKTADEILDSLVDYLTKLAPPGTKTT